MMLLPVRQGRGMWKKLIASTSTTRSHRHPYDWSFSSATIISLPLPLPLRSIHKNTNEISSAMRIRRASSFSPSSLQQQQQQVLECPHCRAPLVRHSHSQHNKQYSYQCANNHSFDVAKQSYTNLVLVQHKKSKEPGDPADMVRARTRFLSSGLYEPVSDAVNDMIRKTCLLDRSRSNESLVIDAGCGEGYYTSRLEQALLRDNYDNAFTTMPTMAAFDISKFAVRWAAANARTTHQNKDNKNDYSHIQWFVANSMDLPVATERCDVLMSLFAPLTATEFGRILKPKGHLVVASAGEDHLMELRQLLYGDTERPKSSKMKKNVSCSSNGDGGVEEETYPRNKLVPLVCTRLGKDHSVSHTAGRRDNPEGSFRHDALPMAQLSNATSHYFVVPAATHQRTTLVHSSCSPSSVPEIIDIHINWSRLLHLTTPLNVDVNRGEHVSCNNMPCKKRTTGPNSILTTKSSKL